ncbi:MAG: PQQ-binding-like beta-propeller repeat protein, partial [Polyangiales bacterium]
VTLWRRRRAGECRVPCGPIQVHHRVEADRQLQLALQTSGQPPVLARDLDLHAVASPVLKLCSELLRALVSVDGAQRNNLRVRTLREEIRGLKSALQGTRNQAGFVNPHAEELRLATQTVPVLCPSIDASTHKSLRFRSRWSLDIEGLEARSTFLCGDRIVSSSERYTLALSRSHGEVLWSAPEEGIRACMMAGSVLLRLTTDGRVELCEVEHGENYATSPVRLRPCHGSTLVAGGGTVPPVAVLRDGDEQLVAIDLRNGAPRWRFCDREAGRLHLRREGRLLLALSSSGVAHAIDVATGEVLWRYRAELEVSVGASIIGDRVLLAARHTSRRAFHLCAIDLFSGARVWQRDLDDAPNAAPIALGTLAALPLGEPADGILAAVDPKDGRLVWMVPDPGVGAGAAILAVDHMALVNAPTGILSCLHTATGELRWQRQLCNPVTDDLPRCLEPVLRGGALFVPSASVHVLRPGNGEVIADAIACELVPDLLRVDERGWVYVVEEHARMAAFA